MKVINKIILTLIIIFIIINISSTVFAIDPGSYKPSSMPNTSKFDTIINKVVGAVQAIGSIASVIALVIIGIKYMTSSIEERANQKQTFIIYIIGAIFVFSISNILQVIYDVMTA